jgi:hypothetical protein
VTQIKCVLRRLLCFGSQTGLLARIDLPMRITKEIFGLHSVPV